MNIDLSFIFMLVGFLLAAWAVVGNDSIQTLGTFLASNKQIKWYWLFAATASIMIFTLTLGWLINSGDFAWGRLDKIPYPQEFSVWHAIAPLVLLFLTRFGIPVSTTFLILSVFASGRVMTKMVLQSLTGYAIAFLTAFVLWRLLTHWLNENNASTTQYDRKKWQIAQWLATMFLWSQWLIHDMANISVYLPREMSVEMLLFSLFVLTVFLGMVFYQKGGAIQDIVIKKTNTQYVRSATIIDIIFACVLLVFKNMFALPMSTTWVFVGLLAGRELAIHHPYNKDRHDKIIFPMLFIDFIKISAGLAVSVLIALLVSHFNS